MMKRAFGIAAFFMLSIFLTGGCGSAEPCPIDGLDEETAAKLKCEDSGGTFANSLCVCGQAFCPAGVVCKDGACAKTAFELSCEASGGTYKDERCECKNVKCDAGLVCNYLTKECPESKPTGFCNAADVFCANSRMYTCGEDNTWKEGETCDKGCHSDQKKCVNCTSDGCEDGRLFTCNDGEIIAGDACKSGKCTDDGLKCELSCTEGDVSCFDGKLQTCTSETWTTTEVCDAGCAEDKESCATRCDDGSTLCVDGKLKTCSGGVYGGEENCDNGASCKSETECGECANESKQCIDDENKIGKTRTCVAGVWKDDVSQCDDVSCDIVTNGCGECKNESKQCIDDENEIGKPRTCIAGVWKDDANQCDDVSCDVVTNECGECKNHSDNICKNDEDTQAGHLETCVAGKIVLGDKCQNNNGSLKYSCEGESEMTVCGTCLNDEKVCEKRGGDDMFWVYLCTHGEWKKQYTCPDGCNEQTNECN